MLQNSAIRLTLVLLPALVLSGLMAKGEAVTTAATAAPALMSSGGTALRFTVGTTAQDDPSTVEASLELDRPTRRLIQQGLRNEGFDPGMPDGLFGLRTRDAIRDWQQSRGDSSTGYLSAAQAELLRAAAAPPAAMSDATSPDDGALEALRSRAEAEAEPTLPVVAPPRVSVEQPTASADQSAADPLASAAENLFWQSIMNSTNPAEFEAYLEQFPNGMFRALAQVRLAAAEERRQADAVEARRRGEAEAERRRLTKLRRPGRVFRDCDYCPEMVVLAGGRVALGRFEVTVGEYRAFATATGVGAGDCYGDSWRAPHASPHLQVSDHAEDFVEHPLFREHAPELLHQGTTPILGPVGKMVIQHQPLPKQRMRPPLHRVRLQPTVIPDALARRTQQ